MAVLILFLQLREIPSHFPAIRLASPLYLSLQTDLSISQSEKPFVNEQEQQNEMKYCLRFW